MKHALALILACCALVAQDKPAAETPKPAAAEKPAEAKPKIQPINVRDELIELIRALKTQASKRVSSPFVSMDGGLAFASMYEADMKAKTEAQRLLLQALAELAKEANKPSATIHHSSNEPFAGN
jgi:hypothetical protein